MIDERLILRSYEQGLVRLVKGTGGKGVVCVIGETEFWFGGETAESETPLSWIKNMNDDETIRSITEAASSLENRDAIERFLRGNLLSARNIFRSIETLYEMYKADWTRINVTPAVELETYREYNETACNYEAGSFNEYLEENGYGSGTLYVCFDEFCQAELWDNAYMDHLIGGNALLRRAWEAYTFANSSYENKIIFWEEGNKN